MTDPEADDMFWAGFNLARGPEKLLRLLDDGRWDELAAVMAALNAERRRMRLEVAADMPRSEEAKPAEKPAPAFPGNALKHSPASK